MRPIRRLLPLLAVAAISSLVTAGALALPSLAEEGDEPEPPAFRDLYERMRAFDECLREHGFDIRPENGRVELRVTPDGVWVNGEKVDAEAFREARRECGPRPGRVVPALPRDDGVPPALRERMERFRDCLEVERRPEEDV